MANIPAAFGGLAFVRSPRRMLTQTIQLRHRVSPQQTLQHEAAAGRKERISLYKKG